MTKPNNPLKNRLDEELLDLELEQLPDMFADHLVERQLDPKKLNITKELVAPILIKMARINPNWTGLPPLDEIWEQVAIDHLRAHLRSHKRDNLKALQKRMKEIADANDVAKRAEREQAEE